MNIILDQSTQSMCFACMSNSKALQDYVQPKLDFLFTARPTAVNLGAAMKRLEKVLKEGVAAEKSAPDVAEELVKEGRLIADEDVGRNKEMSKNGGEWLVEEVKRKGGSGEALNVLTVCNTGSLATSGELMG